MSNAYIRNGVEGRVGSEAEVRSWDVVRDRRWDDDHRNTELLMLGTIFRQCQDALESLAAENTARE